MHWTEGILLLLSLVTVQVDGSDPEFFNFPGIPGTDVTVQVLPGISKNLVVDAEEPRVVLGTDLANSLSQQREVQQESRTFSTRKICKMVGVSCLDKNGISR